MDPSTDTIVLDGGAGTISLSKSNIKNLLGQQFGMLTVINQEPSSKEGRAQWKVQCSCGKEFITKGKYLLNGDTTSCGCRWRTLPEPEIGQRFGELSILKHLKGQDYLLLCDCGNTTTVKRKMLYNGHWTSCGICNIFTVLKTKKFGKLTALYHSPSSKRGEVVCRCDCGNECSVSAHQLLTSRNSCGNCPPLDLSNQKFGRLFIIKKLNEKPLLWGCLCDCGNFAEVLQHSLTSDNTTSCGCLAEELLRARQISYKFSWKGDLSALKCSVRNSHKMKRWRNKVFERDNYICQDCSYDRGGVLNAHHIIYFSEIFKKYSIRSFRDAVYCSFLWNIDNGVTLCNECHAKRHEGELAAAIIRSKAAPRGMG